MTSCKSVSVRYRTCLLYTSETSDFSDDSYTETTSTPQVVENILDTGVEVTAGTAKTQITSSQSDRKSTSKAGPRQIWKKGQFPEKPYVGPLDLYNFQVSD